MNMGFWQWVVIVMWGINLLLGAILHGRAKVHRDGTPMRFSFEQEFASVLWGFIVLYFGGFFK